MMCWLHSQVRSLQPADSCNGAYGNREGGLVLPITYPALLQAVLKASCLAPQQAQSCACKATGFVNRLQQDTLCHICPCLGARQLAFCTVCKKAMILPFF
jgi:hypothetical protein